MDMYVFDLEIDVIVMEITDLKLNQEENSESAGTERTRATAGAQN